MHTTTIASQIEARRIDTAQDYQFVMRCQDGVYGSLVRDVALDVVARETVDGSEPDPADLADAIIADVRQTEQDVLRYAA